MGLRKKGKVNNTPVPPMADTFHNIHVRRKMSKTCWRCSQSNGGEETQTERHKKRVRTVSMEYCYVLALASVASRITRVSITLFSFPFHGWGNWGIERELEFKPRKSAPEPQSPPLPCTSIAHSLFPHTTSATSSHESRKISYGLSLFFPPDSHTPIPVARRENSERCGVWWLWHSGYDTATCLLDSFNSNLGLWPVQVKSDSVEPETQKQREWKPLAVAKSHLSGVRGATYQLIISRPWIHLALFPPKGQGMPYTKTLAPASKIGRRSLGHNL